MGAIASNYIYQGPVTITQNISDDGLGNLIDREGVIVGSVDYTTGAIAITDINVDKSIRSYSSKNGTWNLGSSRYYAGDPNTLSVKYALDTVTPSSRSESASIADQTFELSPTTANPAVPGSILFTYGGKTYFDRDGVIYTDFNSSNGSAVAAGSISYETGLVSLTSYSGGASGVVTIQSMVMFFGRWTTDRLFFRTPGAPLRPGSFYIRANKPDGSLIAATGDLDGNIAAAGVVGKVTADTGVVDIQYGALVLDVDLTAEEKLEAWYDPLDVDVNGYIWRPDPIVPSTAKFNAVVYSIMPLNADILGLDPVRLPLDGRVPIIRSADVLVIHNTQTEALPDPVSAGQAIALARGNLDAAHLTDAGGVILDTALYTINRTTGVVTMASPLDLTGYTQPLQAVHRIEDMVLVNEAEINGTIALVGPVSRNYTAAGTFISSALIFGDMASRVHHLFSQQTWSNTWTDERSGNPTTAQYNDVLFPIQVNNLNSAKERWALIFTSATAFNVVGEQSGVIGTGTTSADCAPINPVTSEPYFTVLAAGWGQGWATGNVLRFNTDAANAPFWVARTTISGAPTAADDSFRIQIRGDAD